MIYSGNVQGVGFRFTVEKVAIRSGLTGFVKNLYDGTVEVMAEGNREQLESFLEGVHDIMTSCINDTRIDWESSNGEFSSFGIKF